MNTTAGDIMSTDLLTIQEECSIGDAVKFLINNRITGMPVLNKKGKMIGVVSEFDILQQINKAQSMKPEIFLDPVKFSKVVDSVSISTPLEEVVERFIKSKYRRLPVLDKAGKLKGIITRRDLMRVFYYRAALS
jgi:CBS-domain-containing membrane protein